MKRKTIVAMLLAGGEGRRLAPFTEKMAKPALSFGGKYRIIDFPLSNCANSGIDTVGILTQYRPLVMSYHIGTGAAWGLDRKKAGITLLPPHIKLEDDSWYKGTANAVYQNIEYLERYNPDFVLILSGDHIYKMDYGLVLDFHLENDADATVCVLEVPWKEAPRFGIMNVDEAHRITRFDEKPAKPESNLASMGVYIFNWKMLRTMLEEDEANLESRNDFGGDIIPRMLAEGKKLMAYPFSGYWRDVGTIESLWEASMDLLSEDVEIDLYDEEWPVVSINHNQPAVCFGPRAMIRRSLAGEGARILGNVNESIVSVGARVETGARVDQSILMPGAHVGRDADLYRVIVGEHAIIGDGIALGDRDGGTISVVNNYEEIR